MTAPTMPSVPLPRTPAVPRPPAAPRVPSVPGANRGAPAAGGSATGPSGQKSSPANAMRFEVDIDDFDLGSWTSFEGLTFTYDVKTYEEGGENTFVHQLPGRLKYENIKVARPVDAGSAALAEYFTTLAAAKEVRRGTATVTAFNDNGERVHAWTFTGVYPVRYTGPSFAADNSKVAVETFEFAHRGLQG